MTAGELKARKRLLACDYLDTAMNIAGSRAIAGFCSGGFDPPSSSMEILSHAIAKKAATKLKEEHLNDLPFIEDDEGLFDHPAQKLQKLYAEHHMINWDKVGEKVAEGDSALIDHVASELATMMTRITTHL